MCGIFGYISNQETTINCLQKKINKLFNLSESRGKEAAGIAIYHDKKINVYKKNITASKFIKTRKYKSFFENSFQNKQKISSNFAVIGHSRLVTNGTSELNHNNQPLIKDGFVSIHNGIITNVDNLYNKYNDLNREFEIDTEIFLSLLRKYTDSNKNIYQALKLIFNTIEGTASIAILAENYNYTILATNNGSLYYHLNKSENSLIFASEKNIIKRHIKYNRDEIKWIEPFSCIFIDNINLSIQTLFFENKNKDIKFDKLPKKYPIIEYNKNNTINNESTYISTTNKKLLENNLEKITKLKKCSKCLLPETFPFIIFDDKGACNYCNSYEKQLNISKEEAKKRRQEFKNIKSKYENNHKIPVIVPFSGGRDSSYGLHYIKNILNFAPITFTYDWGMVTDLARRNIARICGKLGIENILISADIKRKRNYIKKNVLAWLKEPDLGLIPLFMAGDKYFFYYVNKIRKDTGIKLNIWMGNRLETTNFKSGFAGIKPEFSKKFLNSLNVTGQFKLAFYYFKNYMFNPLYINSSIFDTMGAYFIYYAAPRKDTYLLYDFIKWDEKLIEDTLINEYNWEISPDTQSTWRIGDGTASFYNYIYYTVAGFSEIDTFRSNQIREGIITREEGLNLAENENQPRYDSIKWYCDTINIDFEDTIKTINKIPKLY